MIYKDKLKKYDKWQKISNEYIKREKKLTNKIEQLEQQRKKDFEAIIKWINKESKIGGDCKYHSGYQMVIKELKQQIKAIEKGGK